MGLLEKLACTSFLLCLVISTTTANAFEDDRCRDDSFCKAYCLSTNPDTVSARCGRDLASCICMTPDGHAVKVRFIEERNPVPPTQPTTQPPPTSSAYPGIQYVTSQSVPNRYNGNGNGQYNGNGNSIVQQQQPPPQQQKPDPMTPVLLECDASERSTKLCHLFCTMEIRAWYGLCNITSKACACFGIPLSAVQQEPIAAIFHSTAPSTTPAPTTTPPPQSYYRPGPGRPGGHQQFPLYQYPQQPHPHPQQPQRPPPNPQHVQPNPPPHSQPDSQPWRPIPSSYQPLYNYYQHPNAPPPTVLNPAPPLQGNQLHEQGPVRSAANLFGPNGQPIPTSFSAPTPDATTEVSITTSVSASNEPSPPTDSVPASLESDTLKPAEDTADPSSTTAAPSARGKRSINDTPLIKSKDTATKKEKMFENLGGNCSRYKCAISCKKNNYFAPDCQPKCIDDECWCECFPRL